MKLFRLEPRVFLASMLLIGAVSLSMWGCGGDESITSLVDLKAPETVKNVQATPGDRRVRLTWTPNTEADLVGYNIYRSTSSSGGFVLVGSTGKMQAPFFEDYGPDLNGDNLPDGLVNNMRYFYKVTAFDKDGRESSLDLASVVSAVPGDLPPGSADLDVKNVRAYGGAGIAVITWDLNLNSLVYGYKIYRSRLGDSAGFKAIAIVPQNVNSYTDAGLSLESEYVYRVAPITADLLEGRQTESRTVRIQEGDSTVPKQPGHDPTNGPFVLSSVTSAGVTLQWGRPTENTDGSIIAQQVGGDDLVGGGFIIYRSDDIEGSYRPVGIIENIGTETVYTFTDPYGTTNDFYYVRAFDNSGNLSAPSAIVAADTSVQVPKLVRDVDAFASTSEGAIMVSWTLEPSATAGYRIYRSENPNTGFRPISGVLPPAVNTFTDSTGLEIGKTYWYRVAGVAQTTAGVMLEGSPSPPAPATPGPSDGIFYLEAEDATIIQYSASTDWDALSRQAFPSPFNAKGVLYIAASSSAAAGSSFVTLQWSKEIDTSGPTGPVRTYDVYMSVIRNSSSGIFDIYVQEPVSGTSVISRTGYDFFTSTFGFPPNPTLIYLGQINFVDEDFVGGNPTNETINLRLTYQGVNPGIAAGNGELFFDGLILIRK